MLRVCLIVLLSILALHPARAQPAAQGPYTILPCSSLAPRAVAAVPAPFDAYMQLRCVSVVGQELIPIGSQWIQGHNLIYLVALKTHVQPGATSRLSYYTSLKSVVIPAPEAKALRANLRKIMNPQFLDSSNLIEMDAETSNGEAKQIYLIVPKKTGAFGSEMAGMECDTHCMPFNQDPMIFDIQPTGVGD